MLNSFIEYLIRNPIYIFAMITIILTLMYSHSQEKENKMLKKELETIAIKYNDISKEKETLLQTIKNLTK